MEKNKKFINLQNGMHYLKIIRIHPFEIHEILPPLCYIYNLQKQQLI
jgi:hypothetical protein